MAVQETSHGLRLHLRSERDDALTGERIATTQAAELQHLVDQLRLQISELTEQRDTGLRRADRTEAARQQLDIRLQEALETAKSEREDWTEYVRSVENRALSDVIVPAKRSRNSKCS